MVRDDPALDQIEKIPRFHDDLLSFRMGRNRGMVVVDHIALASAGLEKIKRTEHRFSEPSAEALPGGA